MRKKHRSILGLNTVKTFVVVMLALAIIGVVTLIVLGSISTDNLISQVGRTISGTTANETLTSVTEAGESLILLNEVSGTCSNLIVINSSNIAILSGNYTTSNGGCTLATNTATTTIFNNSNWKVTYDYSYKNRDEIKGVTTNVSAGITGFFGNATTFFALLGVVVIILIISLVVVVVNRFGGGSSGDTGPSL